MTADSRSSPIFPSKTDPAGYFHYSTCATLCAAISAIAELSSTFLSCWHCHWKPWTVHKLFHHNVHVRWSL